MSSISRVQANDVTDPPSTGILSSIISSSSKGATAIEPNFYSKDSNDTLLTDDHIVERVLRYVGTNQYRFIAIISPQYHRVYTKLFTTTVSNCCTLSSTLDNTEFTDSEMIDASDNNVTTTTTTTATTTSTTCATVAATSKQTYYNISTLDHLIICYKDIFCFTEAVDDDDDSCCNRLLQIQEVTIRQKLDQLHFYKYIGRKATLDQIQYVFHTLYCPYHAEVCTAAAGSGRIEVIQFVHENYRDGKQQPPIWQILDNGTTEIAAEFGHLDIVKYLHTHGYGSSRTSALISALRAVVNGHLHVVEYFINNGVSFSSGIRDYIWDDVVRSDHLDMIRFLEGTGCPIDFDSIRTSAALYGKVEIFLYTMRDRYVAPLSSAYWAEICNNAACGGNLEILTLALEQRDGDALTCAFAAKSGHLNIVQYLRSKNVDWDELTCSYAAKNGHLHVLQYAHENGCPWDAKTCSKAACYGHLHVLHYAHCNGCPWDAKTCKRAVQQNHFKILQYANENGCPWDASTMEEAVKNGSLDMVRYAYDNGCPYNASKICALAARYGHLMVFQYLHKIGCPMDNDTSKEAAIYGKLHILQYMYKNGCCLDHIPTDTGYESVDQWTRHIRKQQQSMELFKK